MKLIDLSVNRSTSVYVLVVIIVIFGGFSYAVIPRESNPEIIVPYVVVTTTYEGVSPEDMESLVTVPIERKLTGLSDVKEITSNSVEGASSIVIEFEPDTAIDDALQKVRDKVDLAKPDIPQEADDPMINEINLGELPIVLVSLKGNVGLPVLNEVAEDLEDLIEAVPGVLDAQIIGGVEREIQIEVDPDRVAQYGISMADLVEITRLENVNTPGGTMDLGEAKFLMRTPGEFKTPDELTGLVVKMGPEGVVYLRDIATVRDGFKDIDSLSRVDGQPSVTLAISKRTGQNIIEVADRVRELLDTEKTRMPSGIEIATLWDESDFVRDMVRELENSMLSGLILVVGIIFMFLGIVNSVFIALAIPISMLITFAVLYMSGITMNMVVLFSLTLALGMLVDNGIVIIENIHRHMQLGYSRVEAAKMGAAEVAWPIIGSTVTTVVAFVPMFFWPGIWGKFMVYLPITVILALMGSLFVGMVVNPALAADLMPTKEAEKQDGKVKRHPLLKAYRKFLRLSLEYRVVTMLFCVTALIAVSVEFFSTAKLEFTPTVEPPQANIDIECPEGTNLATSDQYVKQVEEVLMPYLERGELEHVIANVGSQGASLTGQRRSNTTHLSRVTMDFPKLADCKVMPSEIVEKVRGQLEGVTGATVRIEQMDMGPPTGPPINIEISGDSFETLASLAKEIRNEIKDVPGLVDLRDDYNRGKPEVRVIVDRQQAWKTGLNTAFIGITVQAAIEGRKAGDYREGDEEYDVIVRFPAAFREDISNIGSMNLINLRGEAVPFSTVAKIEQGAGLGSVKRIDRKRTVTVAAEVEGDKSSPEVLNDVRNKLASFELPAGYSISYTGENEDSEETETFLGRAFIAALLLIALVLVAQFNSILQPIIIMTSVILSLGGVFLGLYIHNMPFGILMTGIGCISLAGVVVNNAIVLLDFINELRARGVPLYDAVVEAGTTRFRPVMLTAVTTVLGLIPMATGVSFDFFTFKWTQGGESSQWWGSMAIAVIYGLSFATLLTLVVVPTLYTMVIDFGEFFARMFTRRTVPRDEAMVK
ncbi:MAG: efflux RND transporter permease subunit [Candidatus Hydrogenedentes bacterium]|nr:efflux RND transporter permease subunit [Candidatus Hydrogenedentota bacterium]